MTEDANTSDERWAVRLAAVLAEAEPASESGSGGGSARAPDPDGASGGQSAPVAAIGARAARLLDAAAGARPPGSDAAAALTGGPRFATLVDCESAAPAGRAAEAALLTLDALDGAGPRALDRALGTACRLYPTRLLLLVDAEAALAPEALFAFGFRRLLAAPDAVLHEYRLRDYKMPPDWLNARFWANPARFDADDAIDELEDDDEYDAGDEDDTDDEEE